MKDGSGLGARFPLPPLMKKAQISINMELIWTNVLPTMHFFSTLRTKKRSSHP